MHLDITDASPARVAAGVEILSEGGSIALHGITITVRDAQIRVAVFSQWLPENLTEAFARDEFTRAQSIYATFLQQQPVLAQRLHRLPVIYELLDDYGMGAMLLGTFDGNRIEWPSYYRPKT